MTEQDIERTHIVFDAFDFKNRLCEIHFSPKLLDVTNAVIKYQVKDLCEKHNFRHPHNIRLPQFATYKERG